EVRVFVDEFGNLPRILGIETALATLRSYRVGHFLFVQSSTQLTHHYGRELGETIQDHLVTRIILGGAAEADAKAFSQRTGLVTENHPTRSWGSHGLFGARSSSRSYSPERRQLITPAEI